MARPGPKIALVTAGDPGRRTGGYLYNRHVLDALRRHGNTRDVAQIVLPDGPPATVADALRARLATARPAVVIADSIVLPAVAFAVDAIRRDLGIRVLALMHLLPSDLGEGEPWKRGEERLPLVDLERRLLVAADRVVAVSPSLLERLVHAGADPSRVLVILPGRDGCPIPSLTAVPRSSSPATRFLTVANWSENKGIHRVVEALARVDSAASLDLVGEPGAGEYAWRVRELIARHGLDERIHVHGSLAAQALGRLYATADVFVLPSRSEGFGIVYAEAMHFGKPVIAARVGPLPWLVEEGSGVLVPTDDVAALAAAMRQLDADAGLRQRMGETARRRAERLPTWRETETAFRDAVLGLLGV